LQDALHRTSSTGIHDYDNMVKIYEFTDYSLLIAQKGNSWNGYLKALAEKVGTVDRSFIDEGKKYMR